MFFVSSLGPEFTWLAPGVPARGLEGRGDVGFVAGEAGGGLLEFPSRLIYLLLGSATSSAAGR